jgi:hypothetical protein
MGISLLAVVVATVAMFAVGAAWYMGLFAKQWGEMFGFDKLSKAKQKEMQKQMGPYYFMQLAVTVLSAIVLAKLIALLPGQSVYAIAFMVWAGFVLPAQVSAVIFGGVDAKWIPRRIGIMASEALVRLMVAAWVISMIQ